MFPQIIPLPPRNARPLDLNNLRHHQLHNHSTLLPPSRTRAHRYRTLLRADEEVTRGRGATCPRAVLIHTDDPPVAKVASLRVDLRLQVKHRVESNRNPKLLLPLQSLHVDDRGVRTRSPRSWSKPSRGHNRKHFRNHNHHNHNKFNATLNMRLDRR